MTEFTPGPWNVQPDGQIWCDDHPIAERVTTGPWGDVGVDFITGEKSLVHHWGTVATDEAKANARLIAAAPDLYAALAMYDAAFRELTEEFPEIAPTTGLAFKLVDARAAALAALALVRQEG